MDQEFWLNRWKKAETGFHREKPHRYLSAYWADLGLEPGSKVLVPLCGKSSDMIWLGDQGHTIVGSELSPIAIDTFFSSLRLEPDVTRHGPLTKKCADAYTIWQGDVFDLTPQDIGAIAGIYDRAALVALPTDAQKRYASLLSVLAPPASKVFLVSLSFDQAEMNGPPFSTPSDTIASLFSDDFDISTVATNADALLESKNLRSRGLTHLTETLFILTRNTS